MAKRIILPGLSRSTKCSSRSCKRLTGHKGEHRGTLTLHAATAKLSAGIIIERGTEVLSADKYEVLPEVVVLPMAEYQRLVADTSNGRHRTARRARRAPDTTRRTITVSQALGA